MLCHVQTGNMTLDAMRCKEDGGRGLRPEPTFCDCCPRAAMLIAAEALPGQAGPGWGSATRWGWRPHQAPRSRLPRTLTHAHQGSWRVIGEQPRAEHGKRLQKLRLRGLHMTVGDKLRSAFVYKDHTDCDAIPVRARCRVWKAPGCRYGGRLSPPSPLLPADTARSRVCCGVPSAACNCCCPFFHHRSGSSAEQLMCVIFLCLPGAALLC